METIIARQQLLELIYLHLNTAEKTTLEKILELLEDEQDIRDARAAISDSKINGTVSWQQVKQENKL